MVQTGNTVSIHIDIAKDGSGYSLSTSHETLPAYVIKTPEETHWGKYHVLIPITELQTYFQESEAEIKNKLQITKKNGHEGYKIISSTRYIDEST